MVALDFVLTLTLNSTGLSDIKVVPIGGCLSIPVQVKSRLEGFKSRLEGLLSLSKGQNALEGRDVVNNKII